AQRALTIRERAFGPDHPDVARSLNNLANVLGSTGDYAGARRLQERALAILEKALGPDHPDVAKSLNNLGRLLLATGDYAGARPRPPGRREEPEQPRKPAREHRRLRGGAAALRTGAGDR